MSALFLEALSTGAYAGVRTWFYLELLAMALQLLGKTETWVPRMSDTRALRIGFSLATGVAAAGAFLLAKPAIDYIIAASGLAAVFWTGVLLIVIAHAVEWATFFLYLWLFNRQLVSIAFWKEHGEALRAAIAGRKTAWLTALRQFISNRNRNRTRGKTE
jgi:hypothetical protein